MAGCGSLVVLAREMSPKSKSQKECNKHAKMMPKIYIKRSKK
jgi:hypothetical protein